MGYDGDAIPRLKDADVEDYITGINYKAIFALLLVPAGTDI